MIFQTFQKYMIQSYSSFSMKKPLLSRTRSLKLCLVSSSDREKTDLFMLERFAIVKIWIEQFLDLKESTSAIQHDLVPLLEKILLELKDLYFLKGSNSPSEELDQIKKKKYEVTVCISSKFKSHQISKKKSDVTISISQYKLDNYKSTKIYWKSWNQRTFRPKYKAKLIIVKIIEFLVMYNDHSEYYSKTRVPAIVWVPATFCRTFLQKIIQVLSSKV